MFVTLEDIYSINIIYYLNPTIMLILIQLMYIIFILNTVYKYLANIQMTLCSLKKRLELIQNKGCLD